MSELIYLVDQTRRERIFLNRKHTHNKKLRVELAQCFNDVSVKKII